MECNRATIFKPSNFDHQVIQEYLLKKKQLSLNDICRILQTTSQANNQTFFNEKIFQSSQLVKQIIIAALAPFHTSLSPLRMTTPLFKNFLTKNEDFYQLFLIACYEQKIEFKILLQFIDLCPSQHLPTALAYFQTIFTPFVQFDFRNSLRIADYCKNNLKISLSIIDVISQQIVSKQEYREIFFFFTKIALLQTPFTEKAQSILKKTLVIPILSKQIMVFNYCANINSLIKELNYCQNKRDLIILIVETNIQIDIFRKIIHYFSQEHKLEDKQIQEDIYINCFNIMSKLIDILIQFKENAYQQNFPQVRSLTINQRNSNQSPEVLQKNTHVDELSKQEQNKKTETTQQFSCGLNIRRTEVETQIRHKYQYDRLIDLLTKQVCLIMGDLLAFRKCFQGQKPLQLSSGQTINRIGLVRFAYIHLLIKTFTFLQKFPYYETEVNFTELNLLQFIQKTHLNNRWNNIVQLQLQKLMKLVFHYQVMRKQQYLDKFLHYIIDHLTNCKYVFLDSCRFTEQGDIMWLYQLTKIITEKISDALKNHKSQLSESPAAKTPKHFSNFVQWNDNKFLNLEISKLKRSSHFQYWFNFIMEKLPNLGQRLQMGTKSKYFVGEYFGIEKEFMCLVIDDFLKDTQVKMFTSKNSKKILRTGSSSSMIVEKKTQDLISQLSLSDRKSIFSKLINEQN